MNEAFYISATALAAHQSALDAVSNNIANVNSTAYKRVAVRFSEVLTAPEQLVPTTASNPADQPAGAPVSLGGVEAHADRIVFDSGTLNVTGQAMDVAINGDGFFEVLGPSGQLMLWRGGTLTVNTDGYLAASNGMALKQLISVPQNASQITIGSDGTVTALIGSNTTPTRLGQIGLAQVRDTTTLSNYGDGLYIANDSASLQASVSGEDGAGVITQGSLETSNVQLTNEMTSLLVIQRVYGANAQVLQASDELMGIANGLRRS